MCPAACDNVSPVTFDPEAFLREARETREAEPLVLRLLELDPPIGVVRGVARALARAHFTRVEALSGSSSRVVESLARLRPALDGPANAAELEQERHELGLAVTAMHWHVEGFSRDRLEATFAAGALGSALLAIHADDDREADARWQRADQANQEATLAWMGMVQAGLRVPEIIERRNAASRAAKVAEEALDRTARRWLQKAVNGAAGSLGMEADTADDPVWRSANVQVIAWILEAVRSA